MSARMLIKKYHYIAAFNLPYQVPDSNLAGVASSVSTKDANVALHHTLNAVLN